MSFIVFVLILALQGLILGALARLALPGPDPMSLGRTTLLGVAGALLAGLLAYVLFGTGVGFFGAFLGTFALVYLDRRRRGGTLTRPGGARPRRGLP